MQAETSQLAHPWLLAFGLVVLARLIFIVFWRRHGAGAFPMSSAALFEGGRSIRSITAWIPLALELIGTVLLVWALARPQTITRVTDDRLGIDLVIALDASGSMGAVDFQPRNRFEVARELIIDFVRGRTDDRIGIVTFGTRAATRTPVTWDHEAVQKTLEEAQIGDNGDGTAIGMAIATGVNRLRESDSSSRVLVLVTDGINNSGAVDPSTAASLAKSLGIRIYTIGVGSSGVVPVPVQMQNRITGEVQTVFRPARVDLDEESLRQVAETTGGSYFRATDPDALDDVFNRIDALEKSRVTAPHRQTIEEEYAPFLAAGLLLIVLSLLSGETLWMRLSA